MQGPCLDHCYKKNTLEILLVILFSILIGIIIGINLGILIQKRGVYFDFDIDFIKDNKKNNY
jgi:ABC-type proline/glycine betaine transport system permease subunit